MDEHTEAEKKLSVKRSWKRFSLGTLLTVITIVALFTIWLSNTLKKASREAEIVARYNADGYPLARIYFEYEDKTSPAATVGTPPAPKFLRRWSADNLFSPIDTVVICEPKKLAFFEEAVDLSQVDFVAINYCFDLDSLDYLKGCSNLKDLVIEHCIVSDVGTLADLKQLQSLRFEGQGNHVEILKCIASHPNLETLELPCFGWREEEIELVCQMKQLKTIDFKRTKYSRTSKPTATQAMIDRLHRALPETKIVCELKETPNP